MLIFRRKPGEEVILGQNEVKVKVLGIDRGDVVLGFQAPSQLSINRKEIYLRKQESYALVNRWKKER